MVILKGKGVSGGVVSGPLQYFRRPEVKIVRTSEAGRDVEEARLSQALEKTGEQLRQLADQCRREVGGEDAALFEAHILFMVDEEYLSRIRQILGEEPCTAEYAVDTAGREFAAIFASMDDAFMRARADDVKDVTRRLVGNLTGTVRERISWEDPVILAADNLDPSETLQLDKTKLLGFVTREGSANGHTAILARTMGVPAVCGLGEALKEEYSGKEAYLDGESGELILDPDGSELAAFQEKQAVQEENRRLMLSLKGKEDVTAGGRKIEIVCNIASPDDVEAVLANDGRGIGLFRSEFLYMASDDYPSEETQFAAYRAVVSAMEGRRVVIRTLDIGADKQTGYFRLQKEDNPALGMRAIRICLERPEIFRTQLRAVYRASAYGKTAVMFPMITSVWEVRECKRMCAQVREELLREKVPFDGDMEIGIMIETPAAVMLAEQLAKEVDFFSIGTNDLTQYMLACDRQARGLERFFDPRHPALIRAIGMTADAAHAAGIPVAVCGELGADPSMLDVFLELGIDELSVAPAAVLPLREQIRRR